MRTKPNASIPADDRATSPNAWWTTFRARVPRGWWAYGLALIYVSVCAIDRAGYAVLMGSTLLLTLAVAVAFLVAVVQVVVQRERSGGLSILPPIALLIAVPLGIFCGQILLRGRFYLSQAEYESVAKQIVAGAYPAKLRPEHQHLGLWVRAAKVDLEVEGACFLVVTHGFAGHSGYCYASDPAKLGDVIAYGNTWNLSGQLTDGWGLVRD